jgi:hypothetical protein
MRPVLAFGSWLVSLPGQTLLQTSLQLDGPDIVDRLLPVPKAWGGTA